MNDTFMKTKPVFPLLVSMALPNVISMLVNSLYNIVDSLFVAQINEQAMTALSLVFPIQNFVNAVAIGFGVGINALVALYRGAGDHDKADAAATHGMALSVLHGLLCTLLATAIMPGFLARFTADSTIVSMGVTYSAIVFFFAIVNMASLAFEKIFQAVGRMKLTMLALISGCVCNILLDPIFIFGFGMGTGGAGVATALSQSIGFCILLSMFLRGRTVSQFRITKVTRSARDFGLIFFNGAPSFGRQGLNSIGSMLLNVAARSHGDAAVAGMSIVSRIFQFLLSVAIGVGQGLQPVAAFNYGARRFARVRQAAIFTISTAFCFVTVLNILCWFNAEPLIRLFRDDPAVTAVALPALRYQCIAMFLQPVIIVANMMFQSIGKSGRATFLACCRQGVFFIPLILTLPRAFGLLGVEICQPIADVLTFFVTVPFLFPFLRQLVRMDEADAAKA